MTRLILIVLIVIVCLSDLAGQSSSPLPEPTNWGSIQNGKFVSDKLGLVLPIPADWSVISTVEAEILSDAGADILKQGTASDKRIDEAIGRSIRLVALAEKPLGTPGNSVLEIVAVKQNKGVTANMSLAANVALLKGTPYVLKRSLGAVKVGPNTFAGAELEANINGSPLTQRMLVVMHRGYSIVCAISYTSAPQLAVLEKTLAGLSLAR